MITMENFFDEQYIVHQFTKVIRSKRFLFSKNLDDLKPGKNPNLDEINLKILKDDLEFISKEKRERFNKRGKNEKLII